MRHWPLIIALSFAAWTSACGSSKDTAPTATGSLPAFVGTWELQRSNDAYTGEWQEVDADGQTTLFLTADGAYKTTHERRKPATCEGTYTHKGNVLVTTHSCNNVALEHTIERVDATTLSLSLQGRHGPVIYEYTRK